MNAERDPWNPKVLLLCTIFFLCFPIGFVIFSAARFGERVERGNIAVTVHGIEVRRRIGSNPTTRVTTEGQFLLVDLTIENLSKKSQFVNANLLEATDVQGRRVPHSTQAQMAIETERGQGFFLSEIPPGLRLRGKIAFELSRGQRSTTLEIRDGMRSGEKAKASFEWEPLE